MDWRVVTTSLAGHADKVFICDPATGDLYNNDESFVLRVKFTLIAAAIPFYTLGQMSYHLYTLVDGKIGESLWNIVSDVIFGISVLFAVIAGMASPLEGRKLEAIIEKQWQGGVSKHLDCRFLPLGEAQASYLAYCFQTCGNIRDQGTTLRLAPALPAS